MESPLGWRQRGGGAGRFLDCWDPCEEGQHVSVSIGCREPRPAALTSARGQLNPWAQISA